MAASCSSSRSAATAPSAARTVRRTLIPSIPLARKAIVAVASPEARWSSSSMYPARASPSPDSLMPQVRSTRLAMVPGDSPRSAIRRCRSGAMARSNMSAIS